MQPLKPMKPIQDTPKRAPKLMKRVVHAHGLVVSADIAGMKPGQPVAGKPLFALAVGAHVPAIASLPPRLVVANALSRMPLVTM
jgi:hypothetical protein